LAGQKHEAVVPSRSLDQAQLAKTFLFQMLAGNEDWQVGDMASYQLLPEQFFYNIHKFEKDGQIIPVPYDLDLALSVTGNELNFREGLNPRFFPERRESFVLKAFRRY